MSRVKREFYPARSIVIDELLILLFSTIGVVVHDNLAITALFTWDGVFAVFGAGFPFILAGLISWAVLIVTHYYKIIPAGLIVWAGTVVLGLLFRIMNDLTVEPLFILTSTVFIGIFLLGWRFIVVYLHHRATKKAEDKTETPESV